MEQDDIIIDGPLLSRAFRRQIRIWILLGPLVAGALLLLALCLVPTTYTTAVSVAIQQPSGASGSPLAMLAGGSPNKTYMGVLKSRREAQAVERHVHLQQMYGKTERETLDILMAGIKPEDNPTDGLLYISVTLPGPPRLHLLPQRVPPPTQIKAATAQAANFYALALKEYYATSDTDQGSILLRGADSEQRRARTDYQSALTRLLAFNRSLSRVDPRSAPSASSDSAAASDMGALYTSLAQVQTELRAAEVVRQTGESKTTAQIQNLSDVPIDDPLLNASRTRVSQDQAELATASRLFGPEYPRVIRAQTQLDVDQAQLDRQIQGVKDRLTTSNTREDEQVQGLYARQAVLEKQIAEAERQLGAHRELSGELGRLQTEVQLRLGVLTTTLGEAAKIRLDNASAQNRMTIIDYALPPRNSEPRALKLALLCVLPVFLFFLVAVARQYLRDARSAHRIAPPALVSANGVGQKAIAAEEEDAAAPTGGAGKH